MLLVIIDAKVFKTDHPRVSLEFGSNLILNFTVSLI